MEKEEQIFEISASDRRMMQSLTESMKRSGPRQPKQPEESMTEKLNLYREKVMDDFAGELLSWTGFKSIKKIATMTADQITKDSFHDKIVGRTNIAIIFITSSMCSFGVFESRKIPQMPKGGFLMFGEKKTATTDKGDHFVFSLDNFKSTPFLFRKKEELFGIHLSEI